MKNMKKLIIMSMLFPLSAFAVGSESDELKQEIIELKQRLSQLERTLNKATKIKSPTKKVKHKEITVADVEAKEQPEKTEKKAFSPSIQVGGAISTEIGGYKDKKTKQNYSSNVRNAKLKAYGMVHEDVGFMVEVDFAGDQHKLKKAYVNYFGMAPVEVRIGRFIQDFGINQDDLFPESHPHTCLSEFNETGVRVLTHGERWYSSVGFASNNFGTTKNNEIDQSKTLFLRASYAPIYNETNVVHTGISYAHHMPKSSASKITFKQRFENKFLDDGISASITNIDNIDSYGADLGFIHGPFSIQGEFTEAKVSRLARLRASKLKGGYLQMAYSFTGEQREYDPRFNKFSAITPKENFSFKNSGKGAWELAVRYSHVNLNGKDDLVGGKMKNLSTSLNWYLNKNLNVMFNYIHGKTDKNATIPNNKADIYLVKVNFYF